MLLFVFLCLGLLRCRLLNSAESVTDPKSLTVTGGPQMMAPSGIDTFSEGIMNIHDATSVRPLTLNGPKETAYCAACSATTDAHTY
jgi:hypothetical protein